jgi:hypothetical protein
MSPRIQLTLVATLALTAGAVRAARADTAINFFGDVNYFVDKSDVTTNSFQASTLDIFASQTEGKFSFVGEVIVEALGSNDFSIDVDRLEVAYVPRPWLRFRAGRIRSAFGYYGDAYQNGKFFMMPISWPDMYEAAKADGILPSHAIGFHADVAHSLGDDRGKLTLDAEILNGRGIDTGEIPAFRDSNQTKAVNFRLRYVGEGHLGGLIAGANVYVDQIPQDTAAGLEHPGMHELILGGHLVYVADRLHVVSELAWIRHRENGTDTLHHTTALFAEVGYEIDDYTPYVRYENTRFDTADPYFTTSGIESQNLQRVSAGVKYIASASVAFKLQTSVTVDVADTDYNAIGQAAFAF